MNKMKEIGESGFRLNPSISCRKTILGLLLFAAGVCVGYAEPLNVSGVTAAQRAGTKLVDISYNVGGEDLVKINVAVSTNGGLEYDLPCTHFSGSGYGVGVVPGDGKTVVWNAELDCSAVYNTNMRVKVTADDGYCSYFPSPYSTNGWPAQHHDSHNSDWIPRDFPSFQKDGIMSNVVWWLRDVTNNPVVCVGGGTIGMVGTQEYFVVTTGKIRSPNLWALNMNDGSVYWHSAAPTNVVDPGPDSCALTIAPVIDKYGNLFMADALYVYCYSLAYIGDAPPVQPWTWRAPMPNLKTYNLDTGLWHPSTDPTAAHTKGSPFMSFVLTPEVDGQYYVGGFTVEGSVFMFDAENGELFAKAYLETNVIGTVAGNAPVDPYDFAATNDPMALSKDNPIVMGIWATGSNTDDPDLDYFMNPVQLQAYLQAGTFGAGPMVANNPCMAVDPVDPAKCRLYIPAKQSTESARYDSNTNIQDAILYRVDFDPSQSSLTDRLTVANYDYPVTPGVGRFDGRMVDGESSAASPDLSVNEKWVFLGDNNGEFYCFDAETGASIWNYQVGEILGSPTTFQNINSNGWFMLMVLGGYNPWAFAVDADTGQIVSNSTHGLMVRQLPYGSYITNYYWRAEPAYQAEFYTPGTHELWQRRAIGASVILGSGNMFELIYTVGWQRPNDPTDGLWIVPTHQVVMVLGLDHLWDYTNLAQTVQGGYIDTNGTSEVGLILSPSANPRGVLFYGSQSCCVANYLNVNNMMPVGMKPLYMRPYGGLGLFSIPFVQ